jgi:DNA-binding HxlR family transcriptional regulator
MEEIFTVNCSARLILESISKKWAALILYLLAERSHRFGELLQSIEGLSQKVLAETLRALERNGLITRTVNSRAIPVSVTYSLTPLGTSLIEPMKTLRGWVERHSAEVIRAQTAYDEQVS